MISNINQPTELALTTTTPAATEATTIKFFVPGKAQPAGSKRAFMRPGMRFPVVTDDCKESRPWKNTVTMFAEAAVKSQFGRWFALWEGPLLFKVHFFVLRPKGHLNTRGQPRPAAPLLPVVKPDALKLTRAVEDALSQVVYKDDSQICSEIIFKSYTTEKPGVEITVAKITTLEESLKFAVL